MNGLKRVGKNELGKAAEKEERGRKTNVESKGKSEQKKKERNGGERTQEEERGRHPSLGSSLPLTHSGLGRSAGPGCFYIVCCRVELCVPFNHSPMLEPQYPYHERPNLFYKAFCASGFSKPAALAIAAPARPPKERSGNRLVTNGRGPPACDCRQLILILELYSASDVHGYLRHIALKLCADKVSQVRWISFKLVRILPSHSTFL